jgi:membrane-associated protease RseP (regulator of RpoE activity)
MRHVAIFILTMGGIAAYGNLTELRWAAGAFLYFPLGLLLLFLAVLVHELGHALAARLCGARIERIVALPFEWRFRPFRIGGATSLGPDLGGQVDYVMEEGESRSEHALIAAAGPVANLLLGLAAVLFGTWLVAQAAPTLTLPSIIPGTPTPDGVRITTDMDQVGIQQYRLAVAKAVARIFNSLAMLSVGTALANLIPYKGSDGDGIVDALFRGRFRA